MINTIIPTPKSTELFDGKAVIAPVVSCSYDPWVSYTQTLCDAFEKIYEVKLTPGEGGITLVYDEALAPRSYRYDACDGLTLTASDNEGILYAIATLLQAVNVTNGIIEAEKAQESSTAEEPPASEEAALPAEAPAHSGSMAP